MWMCSSFSLKHIQSTYWWWISLPTLEEIESHINYWISYLQHHNIDLDNLDKKHFSVLAIGTKRDQLKSSEKKLRIERVEEIFKEKKQRKLISDWMIVSGKKKQQISDLMMKISHYSQEIVNNQSSFLPSSVGFVAASIQLLISSPSSLPSSIANNFLDLKHRINPNNNNNDQNNRFIFSVDDIKQIPSLLEQPAGDIELALLLLHSIGAIVYQPQTQIVITNPTILIKMMASFVCPRNHLTIMFGETTALRSIPKDAIFSFDEVYERVVGVLNKLGYNYSINNNNNSTTTTIGTTGTTKLSPIAIEQLDQLIKTMEQFGFFYCLDEDEKEIYIQNRTSHRNSNSNSKQKISSSMIADRYYLFPSLRDSGTFQLHQVRSSSRHFTLVVRYQRSLSRPTPTTITTTPTTENNFIPPYIFFHLQVCLRKQRDKESEMWGNGMKLRSGSNEAIILRSNKVRSYILSWSFHNIILLLIIY